MMAGETRSRRMRLAHILAGLCLTATTLAVIGAPVLEGNAGASESRASGSVDLANLPGVSQVQSWLAAASKSTTLPAPLVSKLKDEGSSMFFGDSCMTQPGGSSAAKACSFGDTSATQTVVLYGDSFAQEWIPALNILGERDHFKVLAFTRLGCPFADIAVQDYEGSLDKNCLPFRADVIAQIKAMHPAPSLVLLSQEYEGMVPGGKWGSISAKTWASATKATLIALREPDVPLAVVLGYPIASESPSQCLSIHSGDVAQCATPFDNAFFPSVDKSNAKAIQSAGAAVVNISSLVCTSTSCPDVVHESFVHSDQWHLNEAYVASLDVAFGSLVGCGGTQVASADSPASGVLVKLLSTQMESAVEKECKAADSSPFND
jgi:hypothetical protein